MKFEMDLVGAFIFSLTIAAPGYIITDPTLSKIERERIWVIYIAAFFVIFFWAAFEQAGASLTYFAEEQYLLQRSATKIQSCWRSYAAQVHLLVSVVNVIVIQVCVAAASLDFHCAGIYLMLDLFMFIPTESLAA